MLYDMWVFLRANLTTYFFFNILTDILIDTLLINICVFIKIKIFFNWKIVSVVCSVIYFFATVYDSRNGNRIILTNRLYVVDNAIDHILNDLSVSIIWDTPFINRTNLILRSNKFEQKMSFCFCYETHGWVLSIG